MIIIDVTRNDAKVTHTKKLTSGMKGQMCQFRFSEEWDDLSKIAVCVCGNVVKDAIVDDDDTIEIPWEVLSVHGKYLDIGVYGTDGNGEKAIPTIYATVGAVCKGADPSGDEGIEPTPTIWEQILSFIKNVPYTIDAMGKAIFHGHADSASADEKGNTIHTHYMAVNDAHNTLCNCLKGQASGIGVVRMNGVSPIPHNIEIKTDVPVGFKSYGKNLDPYNPDRVNNNPDIITSNWDLTGNDNYAWYTLNVPCDATLTLFRDKVVGTFAFYEYDADGKKYGDGVTLFNTTSGTKKTQKIRKIQGHTYKLRTTKNAVELMAKIGTDTSKYFDFWLQVEVGTASEYEEYKLPVNGVVSISPTTTLVADTTGVTIEATYNRDINKALAELKNAILNLGGTL